jgi:glycosyltransferase involved in cell wall biosynthesis
VKITSSIRTIAFLGDYLPRKCGIATFTSDLLGAVAARHPQSLCFAAPVNDVSGCYQYPDVVRFEIDEQDLVSYKHAADFLNTSNADVVSIQHEFGIFGGPAGSHLLSLVSELKAPVVTTLHTVLLKPNADQQRVMQKLIAHSTRLVVMTERGRTILQEVYQAPPAKIDLIPHGIPDVPFLAPDHYKNQFGVGGKKVLLTFGLLSPNKGIEHVLNALPDIAAEFPDVVYIVLGATHPNELRTRGEAYRQALKAIAKKNKLESNVIFHNRFVELKELTEFIGAADLYITPYLGEAQITSGTLAYAFGAGKPVISTPYWHAAELLRDERGVLVPFGDARAIAREVSGLLRDGKRRNAMSANAYKLGREMVWSNTAEMYMRSFELAQQQGTAAARRESAVARAFDHRLRESSELNLDYLHQMTDLTGIPGHASFNVRNFPDGYCTNGKARVLNLSTVLCQLESASKRGRAIWTRGSPVGRSPHWSSQMTAERRFALAASPSALAFSLIATQEYMHRLNGDRLARIVREELTKRLVAIFDRVLRGRWSWFEDGLIYDNPDLAHALIVSGRVTGQTSVYEPGQPCPVGCGRFYKPNGAHVDRSNEDKGTASMLAFLLSLAEIPLIQNIANDVQRVGLAGPITQ